MIRTGRVLCMLCLAGGLAVPGQATNYTWSGVTANWDVPTNWIPTGVPSSAVDTGTIASGTATVNTNLGLAGDRPAITVSGSGRLDLSAPGGTPYTNLPVVSSPVTFDGGTLTTYTHWNEGGILAGPVTISNKMYVKNYRGGVHYVTGKISGPGQMEIYYYDNYVNNNPGIRLCNPSNDWTGSVWIRYGTLYVATNRALGAVTVTNESQGVLQFEASQDYGGNPLPTIINASGSVMVICQSLGIPVTMRGGSFSSGGCRQGTGPTMGTNLTLAAGTTNSIRSTDFAGWDFDILGTIDGPGTLRIGPSEQYWLNGVCDKTILWASNSYGGGTLVQGAVHVAADHSLSTGTVVVTSGGIRSGPYLGGGGLSIGVQQNYAAGTQPLIQVNSNAAVYVNLGTGTNLTLDVTLNRGELSGCWSASGVNNGITGTVTLTADSFLGGAYGTSTLDIKSRITGGYRLTRAPSVTKDCGSFPSFLAGTIVLSNPGNDFTGGLDVTYGTLKVTAAGAQGHGPLRVCGTNAMLILDQSGAPDWTITNGIGGKGTIRVEDGTGTNRLTVAGGTVDPGTNQTVIATNNTGVLAVQGRFAFAQTNGQYAKLVVHVAGTNGVAGVDYDQLNVTGGDAALGASIANCDLEVRSSVLLSELVALPPITIISATNADFSAYNFHFVDWGTVNGRVVRNNGNVQIKFDFRAGMVIRIF